MRVSRRSLLVGGVTATLLACARPAQRPEPSSEVGPLPGSDRWNQEARGILSDAQFALRIFEIFAAFRIGVASQTQLAWDPPTSRDWDEATHIARGLSGRAEQLFRMVSTAGVDATTWRQRRELSEATNGLLELGDALSAYLVRIATLEPGGDGSRAWDVLDAAWGVWGRLAPTWGLDRTESLCQVTNG